MIYDFETIFEVIMKSQTDMIELVTKWSEMIAPEAKDVTFNLEGRDPLTVPNFEKMFETINTRTLPSDPSFNSVTATTKYGKSKLTAEGLSFAGGRQNTTYDVNGIQSIPAVINDNSRWTAWPLPRYMRVEPGENPSIIIAPNLSDEDVMHMSDFFVFVPRGSTVTFIFASYGQSQRMTLTAPGNTIWQVCVTALNVKTFGLSTSARAVELNIATIAKTKHAIIHTLQTTTRKLSQFVIKVLCIAREFSLTSC